MKAFRLVACVLILGLSWCHGADTLPALTNGRAPANLRELYADFDPKREPLDVQLLREWEEDGVVLRVVRYRVGIFKGQKSMVAAVYGFPKGGSKLPGLLQIHGGGQYADYRAPLANAKRGYATLSLAWAGRISAPGYLVRNETIALFWAGRTNDPAYRITTDWGALDAYHAPSRNEKNSWQSVAPESWTLDPIDSPRNNSWFLCVLAARRGLSFLEEQPEVDPSKLGVYGHSMGGKITVLTAAADPRVKAAAPSCGGVSDRTSDNALYRATLGDDPSLSQISCPIFFLSPANDFHGRIDDLQKALQEIRSRQWRVTCSPHHNHQDTPEYMVATLLWFDEHLRGTFAFPNSPEGRLELETSDRIPRFTVRPRATSPILAVDIYYTQQGQMDGKRDDMQNTMHRFWHHADSRQTGAVWTAQLPLLSTDKPLWVYANVLYSLAHPVTGAGYYYAPYTASQFNLSSPMSIATPDQLKKLGVLATAPWSLLIESFSEGWQKEWFTYDLTDNWARSTHKLYDPTWAPPPSAKLSFEVRSLQPNKMAVGLDGYAAEISLAGSQEWQRVTLSFTDFRSAAGVALNDWSALKELRLTPKDLLRSNNPDKRVVVGGEWQGPKPEFRELRWLVPTNDDQTRS